jgi:hypothetical protein
LAHDGKEGEVKVARRPIRFVHELVALSRAERDAARAERQAEAAIRKERDNTETAERRAAALDAERRRYGNRGVSHRL